MLFCCGVAAFGADEMDMWLPCKSLEETGCAVTIIALFKAMVPCLVGGLEHECYFPFHIWDVILPIDELHDFSRWLLHHQPDILFIRSGINH